MPSLPPPPPPSPPAFLGFATVQPPQPPLVLTEPPLGAFLIELLIFSGAPFHDHWAYFVRSHTDDNLGVVIHATGDVRNGFRFEIKRYYDLGSEAEPSKRVPLQWVDGRYFDEEAMFNSGVTKFDEVPVDLFESSVYKVMPPGKSLNATDDEATTRERVVQRDCQTWIVESANQLVKDGILKSEIATYLRAIQQ